MVMILFSVPVIYKRAKTIAPRDDGGSGTDHMRKQVPDRARDVGSFPWGPGFALMLSQRV